MTDLSSSTTSHDSKTSILSELWIEGRENPDFADFFEYNDIGLPLAYMSHNGLCTPSSEGESFIDECFELLICGFELEDQGFSSLNQVLEAKPGSRISLILS